MARSLRPIKFLGDEDPELQRRLEDAKTYHFYPLVANWPAGAVSDEINPRSHGEDVLASPVAKAIARTLQKEPENFVLMNRGILLLASKMKFDHELREVKIWFEGDPRVRGLADGGTTDAVLAAEREAVDPTKYQRHFEHSRVHVEVVVGLNDPDRVAKLVEGRNTSRQVQSSSLVNAAGRFDWLKRALPASMQGRIAWEENATGAAISDVLGLLSPFRPSAGQPDIAFSLRKQRDEGNWQESLNWIHGLGANYRDRSKLAASLRDDNVVADFASAAWAAPVLLELYDRVSVAIAMEADSRTAKARPSRKVDAINAMFPPKASETPFTAKPLTRKVAVGYVFPLVVSAHQFCTKEKWLLPLEEVGDLIIKFGVAKFFQATLEWTKGKVDANKWAKTDMNYSTIFGAVLLGESRDRNSSDK
jgi:AIPR protein